jgi:hypothetical protein
MLRTYSNYTANIFYNYSWKEYTIIEKIKFFIEVI